MDAAKCVIVLWSKESVSSDWVKTEAAEGARRGILVPVLIERVKIPLEFRRLQAADLSDWRPSNGQDPSSHPEFGAFLHAVSKILGASATAKERRTERKSEAPRQTSRRREEWYAELIEIGRASRKLRLHLTDETHVVEITNSLTAEIVRVDGVIKCQSLSLTEIKGEFQFEISDGAARRAIMVAYKVGLFGSISQVRVRVAGRNLYKEDT